jgi:hypothetical protein
MLIQTSGLLIDPIKSVGVTDFVIIHIKGYNDDALRKDGSQDLKNTSEGVKAYDHFRMAG